VYCSLIILHSAANFIFSS